MQYVILAAFTASFFWGLEDALSKKPVSKLGITISTSIALVVGIIPFTIVAILYPEPMTGLATTMSMLGGLFWGAGFMLIYKSVSTENVTSTYAINEILPAVMIIFGIIGLGEKISALNSLLIIVIFCGAIIIMMNEGLKFNKRLLYAVMANLSWGIFWILMIEVIHLYNSFAEPLLLARVVAAGSVLAFFMIYSKRRKIATKAKFAIAKSSLYASISIAVLIGIVDAIGNDAFGFVSTTGFVAIGAGIIAISPIFIAALGRLLYKDKLTSLQWAGFGIIVIAGIFLALF
ncbi:MAG: DMT family transporter [Candidatus Marsarchaeota archaeon]|nr:DMT family transporter [Candidatus Marsarchaeota archaeon]MCL5102040.1 DMT family transporter [Candidatus Marsarchaeota archaeon]